MARLITLAAASAALALLGTGCGSSGQSSTAAPSVSGSSTSSTPSSGSSGGAGALSGEARSAATGDIPDNQVFLTFRNPAAGYSVSYPEGWTRRGAGANVTFSDKNNIVHLLVDHGAAPSAAALSAELKRLEQRTPRLSFTPPVTLHVKAGTAVKSTYRTESAQNPVTGKRVLLVVDRYELARGGKRVTVDLGTPKGVDNVDAYRLMINSFRWR